MALEEVSFYTVTGAEINLTNLVNQFVDYYMQKLEVGETKITDFNQGSEIRNLLEAFAVGVYAVLEQENEYAKFPFITLSSDGWLDRIGENPFIKLPRITGSYSEGFVTFTLKEVQTSDFVIPEETIVTDSETGLDFVTTSQCIIFVGETTGEVPVECLTEGSEGNSSSGDVNIISDVNTDFNIDLVTVTNPEAFEGGADYEDDESYRERLLTNVRADGFGTLGYYKALGESVTGVHDVLLIDDNKYTKKVLVNGYVKPVSDEVLLNVLAIYTSINNHILNHTFTVDKVGVTTVDLNLNLTVTNELNEDEIKECLNAFVDGTGFDRIDAYEGLNINDSLSLSMIETALYVFDGFVSATGFNIAVPDDNTVIKLGTINITQNVE